MKNLLTLQTICVLLMFAVLTGLRAQSADWYLQVGGGYLLMDRIEQLGFDRVGPSAIAYAEIGRKFRPLSVGVQSNFLNEQSFYRYAIKQQVRTVYAKYSFNSLIEWVPYGLDPYLIAGASYTHTQFVNYTQDGIDTKTVEDVQLHEKPRYSVGGGIQIGSNNVILGLQYLYTPNKNNFEVSRELENLVFATSAHFIQINIGLRLNAPKISGNRKCPRFGRKGIIRF